MSKTTIYVIECQNSVGAWMVEGLAFSDEDGARRYVNTSTVEILAKELRRDDFAEALGLDIEKDSELLSNRNQHVKNLLAIVELLERRGEIGLISKAAQKIQRGGFYSYETVSLAGVTTVDRKAGLDGRGPGY